MAYNSEAYKREYQSLKLRGICVTCRENPADDGFITCQICRDKRNEYFVKWYHRTNPGASHNKGAKPFRYIVTMKGKKLMEGTVLEIAEFFGTHYSTVRKWVKAGKFCFIFEIRRVNETEESK